jgi:hypothetical protein
VLGNGGQIVVWSDQLTRFFGNLTARGGQYGGDGGLMEVSSKDGYMYGGRADAGAPNGVGGTLLLDPKNIIIDSSASSNSLSQRDLLDPNPNVGGTFGDNVVILGSGNTVVTDTNDNFGGANAGAAYLFNGSTGGLISALTGGNAGDRVGSGKYGWDGIQVLPNGNYLVYSPNWNTSAGAVTFGSATTGTGSGVLSAANSLVGAAPGDNVGWDGIFILDTGNYLVRSSNWNSGTGAITFGSQNTGVKGTVSAANSLVGSAPGDYVGRDGSEGAPFFQLSNGNVIIGSEGWSNGGLTPNAGAITWMDGNTGKLSNGTSGGVIGAANSLLGSGSYEYLGQDVFEGGEGSGQVRELMSGNVLIQSYRWTNGGTLTNAGAVTWMNGATGKLSDGTSGGMTGPANSLVGSYDYDYVGNNVNELFNGPGAGNVLVVSNNWNSSTGAVTWMEGTTGKLSNGLAGGVIDGTNATPGLRNSLIGSAPGDCTGCWGNPELAGGNVLISTPYWSNGGTLVQAGAVTWMNTTNGKLNEGSAGGIVGASNSLVGSADNDHVGWWGIGTLWNGGGYGNGLVFSPDWNGGTGAVTWINGANGKLSDGSTGGVIDGTVNPNSLVGSFAGDRVGDTWYTELANGNAIIRTPQWTSGGTLTNAGAVTWINTATGALNDLSTGGIVSASNSLVGSTDNDNVGSRVNALYGANGFGNAIIGSPNWNGNTGAVTWVDGSSGKLSDGATGGGVSVTNSVIGSFAGDGTGSYGSGGYIELANGNILIPTVAWSKGNTLANAGAVTWMDTSSGLLSDDTTGGVISQLNSVVGNAVNDRVGNGVIAVLYNGSSWGNAFITSPNWSNNGTAANTGALTWIDGSSGQLSNGAAGGVITTTNSLLGSASGDSQGSGTFMELSSGRFIFAQGAWSSGGTAVNAGSVTSIDGANGLLTNGATGGVIGIANSLVGGSAGDSIGSAGIDALGSGNVLVRSPAWNGGTGAVSWMDGSTGKLSGGANGGAIGAGNSLVGSNVNDHVGNYNYVQLYANGNLIIATPNWSNGGTLTDAGAQTWMNSSTGALSNGAAGGVVGPLNSLVGSASFDHVGYASVIQLYNGGGWGNVLILNRDWNSSTGAATWMNGSSGKLSNGLNGGAVGVANSLIGSNPGDKTGEFGYYELSGGNALIPTGEWTNGGTLVLAGAVTWMNTATGKLSDLSSGGVVSAANSIVGSNDYDYVGYYGVNPLYNSGNAVLLNNYWNSNTGAVTWINGSTGKLSDGISTGGAISASNSLIGSAPGDYIGNYGYTELINGNLIVRSPYWSNGGATANAGAATWMNGANGKLSDGFLGGVVGAANSLVGSTAGDYVSQGGVWQLYNGAAAGNAVVLSSNWNGGMGAATWMNGGNGQLADGSFGGAVSVVNSLVGTTTSDFVGSGRVFEMSNGNFFVLSPDWNGGMGAVTFGNGAAGVTGTVTAGSSLVGSTAGDRVGDGGEGFSNFVGLPNGNYLLINYGWNGNAGAVTLLSNTSPLTGQVSNSNSIIGGVSNSGMSFAGIDYTSDTFIVGFPSEPGGRVAVGSNVFNMVSGGGNLLFSDTPGSDATISPNSITATLNTGTAVILQANNDITLNPLSDIVTSAGGAGGDLTLQAGRSIILKSSITTDNGNLTMVANDPAALPAFRDPGPGGISLANATTINAGTGNVNMLVSNGGTAGDIVGGTGVNVVGNALSIQNLGGGNISFGTGMLHATGGGRVIDIAASNGSFSSLADLTADNGDIFINTANFTAVRGNIVATLGDVTITDTGVGGGSGILVKNVTAGGAITLDSQAVIRHDPILGGLLKAPNITLTAVDGIGALGNPLFTDAAGANFSASNSGTGDMVITSSAPTFTVGGGGALINNSGTGGNYISTTGNLVVNGASVDNAPILFFAAGNASVNGYTNSTGGLVEIDALTGITFSGGATNVGGQLNLSTAGALNVLDTGVDAASIILSSGSLNVVATVSPTHLASAGNLTVATGALNVTGGGSPGASAELKMTGPGTMALGATTANVAGGAGAGSFARVYGFPDVKMIVQSGITMTDGAGAGAYARIEAQSPTSIYISFPLLSSGGYTLNGVQQVYDPLSTGGFVAGGAAAILDQNLLISYGLTGGCDFCGSIIGQIEYARQRSINLFFPNDDGSSLFDDKDLPICR